MTLHAKRGLNQISRYGYFRGPGREIEKNYWNASEISLSRREIFHAVKKVTVTVKIFHAVKKVTVTVKIFHAMKKATVTVRISHAMNTGHNV